MSNIHALHAELDLDPLERGYAAMSDEEAHASLRAADILAPAEERIDMVKLLARLTLDEARAVISTLRAAAAADVLVEEGLLQLRTTGLDLSAANSVAMIHALFAGDPPLRGKLLALGQRTISRAEQLGLGGVTPLDVADSRA
jgi:hypothetical protein